ncbi:lysophospholipid acyltransferase family protein [Halonatronum saccharophilum]|uniref:lysophospholipid acyltransferase family protein n=1 Tax=Halonatronum saccharophilum TaxID=150060 RepID=UPI000489DD7A|nr:lysophospholipid acyltransferase family protein [Halonatronum saccharophilum]
MGFFYKISSFTMKNLFKYGARWEVKGLEHIPKEGGAIVVANHTSNFDPPIVGSALNRKINYMAKEELFDGFFKDKLIRALGAFPVKRGRADLSAVRRALSLLKEGELLGLFPEGTRSKPGKLRRAKSGAVMIALKSEVPIIPIGLKGAHAPFKGDLNVNIGEPFTLEKYYGRKLDKEEMREAGKEIMSKIEELL